MIITIGILGTMIIGLLELNARTNKKLKQEEKEHMETMEKYCVLSVKYFHVTNDVKGLKEAEKRGFYLKNINGKMQVVKK